MAASAITFAAVMASRACLAASIPIPSRGLHSLFRQLLSRAEGAEAVRNRCGYLPAGGLEVSVPDRSASPCGKVATKPQASVAKSRRTQTKAIARDLEKKMVLLSGPRQIRKS